MRHCGGIHSQFSLKIFQILDEITGSLQPDLIIQDKTNLFEINIVSQSTGVVASALKISLHCHRVGMFTWTQTQVISFRNKLGTSSFNYLTVQFLS